MADTAMWTSLYGKVLWNTIFLSLLWAFLFSAGTASALGIELDSSEANTQCIIVNLDAFTSSYYIRFNYHSSIADPTRRSPLIVTQHAPKDEDGGYDSLSQTMRREVFSPEVLIAKQQEMQSRGERYTVSVPVEADYFAGRKGTVEGPYECCFSIENPSSPAHMQEVVDIFLVEVVPQEMKAKTEGMHLAGPGRRFKHEETRRVSMNALDTEDWINEIAREADKVRREVQMDYKAVHEENALTAQAIRHKLDLVADTHDMLLYVKADLIHLGDRNARMQRTTESTFTRIWGSAICVILVILAVAFGMFSFTKNLIIKRKLV